MTAAQPLLTTRLTMPPARPGIVLRPRLAERLADGLARALTLISAPAGFGKTTLVAEWLHQNAERRTMNDERWDATGQHSAFSAQRFNVAWLSLDEDDNDPLSFWIYVAAAVRQAAPALGAAALALLQAPQPAPIKAAVAALLNDLAALSGDLVLVLDDYHLIHAQPVHDALAFLLANLPPRAHLVITTRADPPLPLSRLRVRGQMAEIRAADLLFTSEEAERFLNEAMALDLSPAELAALEAHTEGWIAALQLAALALGGRSPSSADRDRLIATLGSARRHIVDYLVDEVLGGQPDEVQQFLLRTSILDRLSAPLCDTLLKDEDRAAGGDYVAVSAPHPSSLTLDYLDRANLFLVPLDAERRWYRYHHLFAECLSDRLMVAFPGLAPDLHRRAARWYEQQGMIDQAIGHALAAEDGPAAARLIEARGPLILAEGRVAALLSLLSRLPDPLVRARPALGLLYARALGRGGQPGAAETYLRFAEEAAGDAATPAGRALRGGIAATRAALGSLSGSPHRTIPFAREALDLLPDDDWDQRGAAALSLGVAHMMTGAIAEGVAAFEEALRLGRQSGNAHVAMTALAHLSETLMIQGRLRQIDQLCREALAPVSGEAGLTPAISPALCLVYVAHGIVKREWNDFPDARRDLEQALALARQGGYVTALANAYIELAVLSRSQGDLSAALRLLDEGALLLRQPDMAVLLHPLLALRARTLIELGDLDAAGRWARERDLGAAEEFDYLAEIEHAVFARLLLAQGRAAEAAALLGRMVASATVGGRIGRSIELLVLQALALREDAPTAALGALDRALELAAPEGYMRTFLDEGPALAALLGRRKDEGGRMKDYAVRLLAAFGKQEDVHPSSFIAHPLIEPLTDRELEVLHLLAGGASNQAIADALIISLGTVKAHISHILGKLDARNRTEAVLRAQDLGLLTKSSPR